MASSELRKLHRLHLIDSALVEIRKRAAALDPGKSLAAEIQGLKNQLEDSPGKKLQSELHDLELQQKGFADKIAKFDKELYGGKIVNPREVEAMQKEIAMLKKRRAELDDRILEIWEELPAAKESAEKLEKGIEQRGGLLAEARKKAVAEQARLQAEFTAKSAERPLAAKEISPNLLQRYEAIRQKHGGIGMGEVVKKTSCGACGTQLPERTLQALKEEKLVTCESCHRILYFSEGVV